MFLSDYAVLNSWKVGVLLVAMLSQSAQGEGKNELRQESASKEDIVKALKRSRAFTVGARRDDSVIGRVALPITFRFGSAQLTGKAKQDLFTVSQALNSLQPPITLKLVGHTDSVGSAEDNYALSLRRAGAVRHYLENAGHLEVSVNFQVEGEGESSLLFPHRPTDASNRRVEFIRLEGE